jgi:uncharacterized protein (DUF1330 family)
VLLWPWVLILHQRKEKTMNRYIAVGLSILVGVALGAAAVQTLHGQARPAAFQIAEVTVTNEDGFSKEFLPVIGKLDMEAGGKFLVRGGKTISVEGTAPAPRVIVIQFESFDKMQSLFGSMAFKQAVDVGKKYATMRLFGVEGVSP